ncbi:MAG: methyltransferase domain-containing protein [Elusimicrobia bacterium]|nr:methyltransferase domain-containing protein [Elusimicrobiota bacterium]
MTTKHVSPKKKSDGDMLDNLGARIGAQIKKGMSLFEELVADAKRDRHDEDAREDREFMGYVKTFLDDRSIGSVTPSSKYLVERMVKSSALEDARVVVEYGPAEGVITRDLLKKMRPDAKLIAVEFNEKFFASLSERVKDPRLVPVRGDVREIDRILEAQGLSGVDRVVSGVPFALFTGRERHEILTKTSNLLNPGGRFVAFGYTTHLIPMLKDYFSDVDIQFEVRNLPPSFIFTAQK